MIWYLNSYLFRFPGCPGILKAFTVAGYVAQSSILLSFLRELTGLTVNFATGCLTKIFFISSEILFQAIHGPEQLLLPTLVITLRQAAAV
jgi:hypothetical protein